MNQETRTISSRAPNIRLSEIKIRNYQAIRDLQLPRDGLAWSGFPDTVVFGGINGSGKTTLLELIFLALKLTSHGKGLGRAHKVWDTEHFVFSDQTELLISFEVTFEDGQSETNCFVLGKLPFVESVLEIGKVYRGAIFAEPSEEDFFRLSIAQYNRGVHRLPPQIRELQKKNSREFPSVIYLPSSGRTLIVPGSSMKSAGKLKKRWQFLNKWERPSKWDVSLEAFLYSARWEDLNAKEEGRPEEAINFKPYADTFKEVTQGRKELIWQRGELLVKVVSTKETHRLEMLSAGEKQLLLILGEIRQHWTPGSIVMIDEPELHLHESALSRLWLTLQKWRDEFGGQLIVATQSPHLFSLAETGTKALLGREVLR